MYISKRVTQKLSTHAFQKIFNPGCNVNIEHINTKFLINSHNFQHISTRYFDYGLRVLRASYKSEFENNLTTFSKLNSCTSIINYSSSKHMLNSNKPYDFKIGSKLKTKFNMDSPLALSLNSKLKVSHLPYAKPKMSKLSFDESFKNNTNSKHILSSFKHTSWQITNMHIPHFMNAHMLNVYLLEQLKLGLSVRVVINSLIRSCDAFMRNCGSTSPILGLHIKACGRLGSMKKGMAQQISKSVGKVPLSSFNQKIDYVQSFHSTRRGVIGLKIWVCYRSV